MIRRAFGPAARPGWPQFALAFGLGALGALGQAPWSLWPLALLGLGGLIWLYRNAATAPKAAWTGWAGGAGYFAIALFWLVEPFLVDIARHGWMAPFALFFMAGGLALLWAVAFGVAHRIGGLIALVAMWTGMEMLRSVLFTGFPWATVGHIWSDHPILQLAALGGTPLLTLLTLTIAAGPSIRKPLVGLGVSLAILGAGWVYGAQILSTHAAQQTDKTVRLVQPNAAQHLKWDPEHVGRFLQRAVDLTAAPADAPPDLIVWPETSVPYPLNDAPTVLEAISKSAGGQPVIVGGNDRMEDGWRNTLVLLGPEGQRMQTYHKHHLVPFGEYIPFGEALGKLGIRGMASRDGGGFSKGPGPKLIDLPGIGPALPLICYELIFPRDLRGLPRSNLLLQITNDAWFGNISGPYQHLAQARLRAVEQGLPVVRAANTGISAVIDPWGRITAQTKLNEAAVLDADLPAPASATLYSTLYDWPMRGLLVVLLIWRIAVRRRVSIDPVARQG
ncbi:apolipoprotein N-acyltransferase [Litoreibacter arenae]|uniref:Apolipoprotein N-acyltransferase n=1 Tax=Litoreibacter arenae DSM 19593 TaxID=1123360 RepID=S9QB20_9RHOB|nr:apolipoprotein N-acyltransferase [Litoreibacter arenae]EPX77142.1 Apolipoprotein N-acyltransferase / Copper homeostasis protein CutE [Litoreibacter arenae DSM 19593]